MISSLFRKPAAGPSIRTSPFKPPVTNQPEDRFGPGEPALAGKPCSEPIKPEPDSLSATATSSAALAALGAPSAALYTALHSLLSQTPGGAQPLQQLLETGKLNSRTLENLSSLTQQPRARGLDGEVLTQETLAILSGPDRNIWQSDRFTCGATNLERQWAENPEGFTSIVAGLSSPEGKARLISGFTLQRAEGSLDQDGSGRTHIDRILQSSIMAAAGAGRGHYDVATDRFSNDRGGGLKIAEISAITAVSQNTPQVVIAYGSKSAQATNELFAKLQPGETFQAAMTNWEGKDHMLLVQGVHDGSIRYFDPADRAQHTLRLGDFLWKTQYLVIPQPMAGRVNFPPESIHSQAQPK